MHLRACTYTLPSCPVFLCVLHVAIGGGSHGGHLLFVPLLCDCNNTGKDWAHSLLPSFCIVLWGTQMLSSPSPLILHLASVALSFVQQGVQPSLMKLAKLLLPMPLKEVCLYYMRVKYCRKFCNKWVYHTKYEVKLEYTCLMRKTWWIVFWYLMQIFPKKMDEKKSWERFPLRLFWTVKKMALAESFCSRYMFTKFVCYPWPWFVRLNHKILQHLFPPQTFW